jgi:hypothetical protein
MPVCLLLCLCNWNFSVLLSFLPLDRFFPCSSGWLWTFDPPTSASQVLELQPCATTPGYNWNSFGLQI